MTVDPITAALAAQPGAPTRGAGAAGQADFAQALGQGIERVDADIANADALLRTLASGGDVAVHDVMIAMEKARISLQFAVETRNRLVESYQELMRMQL